MKGRVLTGATVGEGLRAVAVAGSARSFAVSALTTGTDTACAKAIAVRP